MDIEYLLWLQEWREAINDALTPFLENLSLFAVTYLLLVPAFIYWAIDKKKGRYILASYSLVSAVNALIKLCVCAYRPWIRDPRIVPAGDAIRTATGYSFPSGHSVTAASIYGGVGEVSYKQKRWIAYLCAFLLLLTGFSRNYLGVHTPQDVFCGIFLGILILVLLRWLFTYLDQHPEKEDLILALGIFLAFQSLIFITFKHYPMTYINGDLLVDPQKMMNDGYGDTARIIAFCAAYYVEKKWIRFESTGLNKKGLFICLIGLAILAAMIAYMKAPLVALLGDHWGSFVNNTIRVSYIVAFFPWIIKLTTKKETNKEK